MNIKVVIMWDDWRETNTYEFAGVDLMGLDLHRMYIIIILTACLGLTRDL